MAESKVEIDILLVGQTGVGKSSLVNMIRPVEDGTMAAEVSNDARPCTLHTTCYPMQLEPGLHCQFWDTRGLDEAVGHHDRWFVAKILDRIRQLASQQERELKEAIRSRTKTATPILMWCMHATKIDVLIQWQQFQRVYVDYCERKAIPVVVLTRMPPRMTGWEPRCKDQLQKLGLGIGSDSPDVYLVRVREHRNMSSTEYTEDREALRDLISHLVKRVNVNA